MDLKKWMEVMAGFAASDKILKIYRRNIKKHMEVIKNEYKDEAPAR